MAIKSRSVNIVLLPEPSSTGNVVIDGSMSFIHECMLLGMAIKTNNPNANSKCAKILTIVFILYSQLFEKGDESGPEFYNEIPVACVLFDVIE
jgi:hypothetical protein